MPTGVIDYYTVDGVLYPASVNLSTIAALLQQEPLPRRPASTPRARRRPSPRCASTPEKIKAAGVVEQPVVLKMDPWFIETRLTGAGPAVVDNDNGRGDGETTEAPFDNERPPGSSSTG